MDSIERVASKRKLPDVLTEAEVEKILNFVRESSLGKNGHKKKKSNNRKLFYFD